jgi:hypothetical protein
MPNVAKNANFQLSLFAWFLWPQGPIENLRTKTVEILHFSPPLKLKIPRLSWVYFFGIFLPFPVIWHSVFLIIPYLFKG